MNFDNVMRYSKNHEWIKLINQENVGNNKYAYIGITAFAKKELGDIVYLDIEEEILGKTMNKNEVFGTIEAVKTVSDLFIPISGIVLEINEQLISQPEILHKDPYEEWMIKIKILDINEYHGLMSFQEYEEYTKKT
ncbi:glycine cleavage system protein GcvH [Blattabacterium cuenoti]|uniref:glycine cleavage system protein GcvH n=1 Tax=Blattabacterium cuenoti TaxID=1653831 RepID=UPI00163C5A7B|nr:glycine cleavage system protein GcvH [Blattabacterium cuenoti]